MDRFSKPIAYLIIGALSILVYAVLIYSGWHLVRYFA